jgi:hypothetical protein
MGANLSGCFNAIPETMDFVMARWGLRFLFVKTFREKRRTPGELKNQAGGREVW